MSTTRTVHRRRNRLVAVATVCAGAALTVVATTGVAASLPVSQPAAASHAVVFASNTTASKPLSAITADARAAIDRGHAALTGAASVTTDIAGSGLDVGADTSIDTSGLESALDRLSNVDTIPLMLLPGVTDAATEQTDAVASRVAGLQNALDGARAAKAAADAAAAAAAAAEAQRQAEAAAAEAQRQADAQAAAARAAQAQRSSSSSSSASAPAVGPVDPGSVQGIARAMMASQYGWGDDQFACLVSLWNRESGWNYQAYNSGSGAGGIPQALPASKMASAGADWATNPATQIAWGLGYIAGSYGTPCAAWGHSQSTGWY
ncbi:hypothetical protein ABCS02_25435 [Microbacterium sp. X-17]|uniref:aggregation-promoting factor C-terminal-like domain-containing protein n=1 Tax=Microbacterium sp. X-17 TaxID=3144404 RepID=UPI0031F5AB1F